MKYLRGYSEAVITRVRELAAQGRLGEMLLQKYRFGHEVRTDRALYDYMLALKGEFLRSSEPLSKVLYDNRLQLVAQALGTHTTASRVQGGKLKAKREIRIAALFKDAPEQFLKMIVVHELAHLKVKEHDKAFYKLCAYMEPNYDQYEFDCRVYLTHLEASGPLSWPRAAG